jgi:hypothetical protein
MGARGAPKAPRSSPCAKAWCGVPRAAHAHGRDPTAMTFGLDGVLGQGAGTPFPKRDETANVSLAQEARCRRCAGPEGMQRGTRSGFPLPSAWYYHAQLAMRVTHLLVARFIWVGVGWGRRPRPSQALFLVRNDVAADHRPGLRAVRRVDLYFRAGLSRLVVGRLIGSPAEILVGGHIKRPLFSIPLPLRLWRLKEG